MISKIILTLIVVVSLHNVLPAQPVDCSLFGQFNNIAFDVCGKITVPENYDKPAGKKLNIAYGIIRAKTEVSPKEPIIICTGGPGGPAIQGLNRWARHPFLNNHDLIIFDQRGIGFSDSLPQMGASLFRVLANDFNPAEELQAIDSIVKAYRSKISYKGIDLSNYNTLASAADVNELMKQLSYDKYILYGESYGTRLVRTVLDMYPKQVASAILDSPAVQEEDFLIMRLKNLDNGIEKIFNFCASDSVCNSRFPGLETTFRSALKDLSENPIKCLIGQQSFTINPQDALYLLRYYLYRWDANEQAPKFISDLKQRNIERLSKSLPQIFDILRTINFSVFLAIEISEETDNNKTVSQLEKANENYNNLPYPLGLFGSLRISGLSWNKKLNRKESLWKQCPVPTLLLTNEFDPATPPEYAVKYVALLPNSILLVLNQFGHGAGGTTCINNLMAHFADNSKIVAEFPCLAEIGITQEINAFKPD